MARRAMVLDPNENCSETLLRYGCRNLLVWKRLSCCLSPWGALWQSLYFRGTLASLAIILGQGWNLADEP